MEIKTCEQYVLDRLNHAEQYSELLESRLAKAMSTICEQRVVLDILQRNVEVTEQGYIRFVLVPQADSKDYDLMRGFIELEANEELEDAHNNEQATQEVVEK